MKGQAKVIVVSRRVEPRYWMAPKFKYYEIEKSEKNNKTL